MKSCRKYPTLLAISPSLERARRDAAGRSNCDSDQMAEIREGENVALPYYQPGKYVLLTISPVCWRATGLNAGALTNLGPRSRPPSVGEKVLAPLVEFNGDGALLL